MLYLFFLSIMASSSFLNYSSYYCLLFNTKYSIIFESAFPYLISSLWSSILFLIRFSLSSLSTILTNSLFLAWWLAVNLAYDGTSNYSSNFFLFNFFLVKNSYRLHIKLKAESGSFWYIFSYSYLVKENSLVFKIFVIYSQLSFFLLVCKPLS